MPRRPATFEDFQAYFPELSAEQQRQAWERICADETVTMTIVTGEDMDYFDEDDL